MTTRRAWLISSTAATIAALALAAGCAGEADQNAADTTAGSETDEVVYTIGVIAKSNSNPPFQAAKTGKQLLRFSRT